MNPTLNRKQIIMYRKAAYVVVFLIGLVSISSYSYKKLGLAEK